MCESAEKHGLISNHLAGAAWGLLNAGDLFGEADFHEHGQDLLNSILSTQSEEGWFPEYGAADPGYQTLCMHYLAQIYQRLPSAPLKEAINKSLEFLQYFVHPDGSFGGEYGSRRTEIYYPGGIALLADEFPLAAAVDQTMRRAIENLNTITLIDIDMGNTAPLLSSAILALENGENPPIEHALPFEQENINKVFPTAGLAAYGNSVYYSIFGISNGGVFKVFDKKRKVLMEDDCGAVVETSAGDLISTQSTSLDNDVEFGDNQISFSSGFFAMNQRLTTPFNYLVLRLLNLTLMRIGFLNEWIKKWMVSWLIKSDKPYPVERERTIAFLPYGIKVDDRYTLSGKIKLKKLLHGVKFNAIHMASSRYYVGTNHHHGPEILDHQSLNTDGFLEVSRFLEFQRSGK